MMLKPFQIKDLHVSSSPDHGVNSETPSSHGVVQISAADYDDIATNHPRARLTYIDDDDDEQITVRLHRQPYIVYHQLSNHFSIGGVFFRAF
jgi:hypothetical protein